MAVVWKARDEVLGRSVAVKLLAGRYAGDERSRTRILEEARAAATLSHPNVAQVYDFGESDEDGVRVPYVVMELINGPTLAQKVSEGPIPPRAVFRICSEVAAALAAAHALGLVHRDIKPANVMVTPARAKVVDFGLAAAAGPGRPNAELLGTPAYLAPERLLSDTVEPASDVYALGVLLYRLLTNESPWSVDTTTQMLDAHIYIEPNPMPQLPGVPVEVTALVTGCLRKEPGERPTAAEASTILADAAEASVVQGLAAAVRVERPPAPPIPLAVPVGSPARSAATPPATGPKPDSRRKKALAAGGVAAAVVAALLLWVLWPSGGAGSDRDDQAAVVPAASARPSAAVDAPGPNPAPGEGGEQTPGNGSVVVPGAGGPLGSGAPPPAPATGVPDPGQTPGATVPATTKATKPTTEPPATTEPPSGGKTLSSSGGAVVAQCLNSGQAELTSWDPAEEYKVDQVSAGPALAAVIVFKKKATRIRMTVTCVAGIPTAVVLPL
jgi:serine/threonine-protein kinase